MTVTDVQKDTDTLTMTITNEFDAGIEAVWTLWGDPRKLERWWGPPTYPATVEEHDLTAGGTVTYFMTGPEGETPRGYWRVLVVEPPRHLEVEDGFARDDGEPDPNLPTTRMRVTLSERPDGGTRMDIVSTFPSAEAMQEMLSMGLEEGIREALGQADALV